MQVPYVFIGSKFIGGAVPAKLGEQRAYAFSLLHPGILATQSEQQPLCNLLCNTVTVTPGSCHWPGGDETVALYQLGKLPELLASAGATPMPGPDL